MENFIQPVETTEGSFYFIAGKDKAKYPYSNSLIIGNILIDTGISQEYLRKLKEIIPIKHVILSHWHEDHTAGNYLCKDAKFYIHSQDRKIVEHIQTMSAQYGIIGTPVEDQFSAFLEGFNLKNTTIAESLEDNQILEFAKPLELQVIHTPGHSAGHCCFVERKTRIAFLADLDLTTFGPWYGCLDSNLEDFEKSIEKVKLLPIDIAITSHKGIIMGKNNIQEKLRDYGIILKNRDNRILEALNEHQSKSVTDLVGKFLIYPSYNQFKDYLLIAERIMINFHLQKLLRKNKIELCNNGYIRK
jgi:glyoxylase-like metal-dependent hydrolase (beta-lactamase superfamily II)